MSLSTQANTLEHHRPDDQNLITTALRGTNGEEQQRIADVGVRWLSMLLRKNADYGSSAWNTPVLAPEMSPGDAILVRMSDKISRISSLRSKQDSPQITDESLEDTVRDLGAYCLLWLARPKTGGE